METLDIVISRNGMLASPTNYKLWRTTIEYVFEKEDLSEFFESTNGEEIGLSCNASRA